MKAVAAALVLAAVVLSPAAYAQSGDPGGLWLSQGGETKVRMVERKPTAPAPVAPVAPVETPAT